MPTDYSYDNGGFPSAPATNDTLVVGGTQYTYNGTTWDLTTDTISIDSLADYGGAVPSISKGDFLIYNPKDGQPSGETYDDDKWYRVSRTVAKINLGIGADVNIESRTTAPTASDDNYSVGTLWIDVDDTKGDLYICIEQESGNAVWALISTSYAHIDGGTY